MLYEQLFKTPEDFDFSISSLGKGTWPSPVRDQSFVSDSDRILVGNEWDRIEALMAAGRPVPVYEKGGPRKRLFHNPDTVRAAIVTCGGLCPGLNDVIKGIVETMCHGYGAPRVLGIRYGYRGLVPTYGHEPISLTMDMVDRIHEHGGTILGSSRGEQDVGVMCDTLEAWGVDILFAVGGDGTLRGAAAIADEMNRTGRPIGVVGVPKTIDNDLNFVGRTFGFETSVYSTAPVLSAAHMEAKGAPFGVGLVKLMGRDSGFIAAYAALANTVVNFCFIPEDAFFIDGENGLLAGLSRRFDSGKDHAVIVVAEGAGQHLFQGDSNGVDASGNVLKKDIGELLKSRISQYFKEQGIPGTVKYFDPSYQIRSVPALGTDAILCYLLAEHAVHAAMAGRTGMVVGHGGGHWIHVPIGLATRERQHIDTRGSLWQSVLSSTQQNKYLFGKGGGTGDHEHQ